MRHPRQLVVVGSGMAGTWAVEEILARDGAEQFSITMFGDEPVGNYDRTMLGQILSGEMESAEILLNPVEWYREKGVILHTRATVERVNRATQQAFSNDGRVTPFDVLVIATGSRPSLPSLAGMFTPAGFLKPGIFTFRTLVDAERIIAHVTSEAQGSSRRAVVLGGGLPALEAARGLRSRGIEVEMCRSGEHPAVVGTGPISALRFPGRPDVPCDLLVLADGVRPNVELAVRSGLPVERAIVVDHTLRVQDEADIYAVGECAQFRGEICDGVAPVWEQASVMADHVTGTNPHAAFRGAENVRLAASPRRP